MNKMFVHYRFFYNKMLKERKLSKKSLKVIKINYKPINII
ncbi:MAG: helix-turn-helix domain-containing protein [Promethearchaeota archaeon]